MSRTLLSFVVPCYRSELTIRKVYEEIRTTVAEREEYDYEILAVNDNSPDGVLEVLKEIAKEDLRFKVISFAKNMGKHAAVLAGYSCVKGDYILNLDDDYQSPAYRLWDLVDPLIRDECDIATAKYPNKKEAAWKRLGSDLNQWTSALLLDKPKYLRMENFVAMKRFVADEVIK